MIESLFQPTHLAILLAIALLIFGGRKLPELGQALGKSIRGFRMPSEESKRSPRKLAQRQGAKLSAITTWQRCLAKQEISTSNQHNATESGSKFTQEIASVN